MKLPLLFGENSEKQLNKHHLTSGTVHGTFGYTINSQWIRSLTNCTWDYQY